MEHNHDVLSTTKIFNLADQGTNCFQQIRPEEGGGGPRCRSFVTRVVTVLEKVGDP